MRSDHRISAGKRAQKRLKAEIKRLKRSNARLSMSNASPLIDQGNAISVPSAAMIYGSELTAIHDYSMKYPKLETGGSMFGWYSETGLPIIALITGPGKRAMHHPVRFRADAEYSMAVGNAVVDYGLQHIGEWHSHHEMGLNHPSEIDRQAMYSSLNAEDTPVKRFLCGIANIVGPVVTLNAFFFSIKSGVNYSHTPIVVKHGDSPIRIGLKKLIEEIERKGDQS